MIMCNLKGIGISNKSRSGSKEQERAAPVTFPGSSFSIVCEKSSEELVLGASLHEQS